MAGFDDTKSWDESRPAGTVHPSTIDTEVKKNWEALRLRLADTVAGTANSEHEGYTDATTWPYLYHKEGSARIFVDTHANRPAAGSDHAATGITIREGHLYFESDTLKLFYNDGTNWIQLVGGTPQSEPNLTYSTGTISVTQGTTTGTLSGTGTSFVASTGVSTSSIIKITEADSVDRFYTLAAVNYHSTNTVVLGANSVAGASGANYVIYNISAPHLLSKAGGTINGTLTIRDVDAVLTDANITCSGTETVDGVDVSAHDHSGAGQGGTVAVGSVTNALRMYTEQYEGNDTTTTLTPTGITTIKYLRIAISLKSTGAPQGWLEWWNTDTGYFWAWGAGGLQHYDNATYGGPQNAGSESIDIVYNAASGLLNGNKSTYYYNAVIFGEV